MPAVAAAAAGRRAASERRIQQSSRKIKSNGSIRRLDSSRSTSNHSRRRNPNEVHDSEYGSSPTRGPRPGLTRDESLQKGLRSLVEDTSCQRQFQAKIMFKEFCTHGDRQRMKVDQLLPYMSRVFNKKETSFKDQAVKMVLDEAIGKSEDEPEGVLYIDAVVAAVMKYGEFEEHCDNIQTLFQRASHLAKDGRMGRQELRKLITNYEGTQTRNTEYQRNVLIFVTEDDLTFILRTADQNRNGDIDATEAVRAIEAWEQLVAKKIYDFEQMNCQKCGSRGCTIS